MLVRMSKERFLEPTVDLCKLAKVERAVGIVNKETVVAVVDGAVVRKLAVDLVVVVAAAVAVAAANRRLG